MKTLRVFVGLPILMTALGVSFVWKRPAKSLYRLACRIADKPIDEELIG